MFEDLARVDDPLVLELAADDDERADSFCHICRGGYVPTVYFAETLVALWRLVITYVK